MDDQPRDSISGRRKVQVHAVTFDCSPCLVIIPNTISTILSLSGRILGRGKILEVELKAVLQALIPPLINH